MPKSDKKFHEIRINEWTKFLREDRDWDYAYIIEVIRYKLERTRKCIVENNIASDCKKIGKEIKEVEDLLKKVTDDNYEEILLKPYYKKYGKFKFGRGPLIDDKNVKRYPLTITQSKVTPKNQELAWSEFKEITEKAFECRKTDLRKAFELMAERIWNWWD